MLFSVILKYFSRPHSFCWVNSLCFLQCVQVPSDSPSQLHPHNSCGTSADIPSGDPGSQTCCNRMKMQHVRIKNTTLKHLPETHITHLQTESRRTPNKTTNHNVWRGRPVCILLCQPVSSNSPSCRHTCFSLCLRQNERNREKRDGAEKSTPSPGKRGWQLMFL